MSVVWQTLDMIAGNNNLYRRHDSFQAGWAKSFQRDLLDSLVKSQWMKSDADAENGSGTERSSQKISVATQDTGGCGNSTVVETNHGKSTKTSSTRSSNKKRNKKRKTEKLPKEYHCPVDCSFNVPRITARLESLMGSNIVRLTDRSYMHQLRQNFEADVKAKLQKRIEIREAQEKERQNYLIFRGHYSPENCPKDLILAHSVALAQEMERERNLIMKGKLAKIPKELETHPVFIVNQKTNNAIAERRSKLKTVREKNAERLIRQGAKWERDRLVLEHLEKKKELELQARKHEQTGLEDQYRNDDAIRGMDLLRIHNREWKPCELDLKKFLEGENAQMKQRLVRQSVQYSSDAQDIQNIVRARKKFRDTERKIRKRLEEQYSPEKEVTDSKDFLAQTAAGSLVSRKMAEQISKPSESGIVEGDNGSEHAEILPSDDGLQTDEDLSGADDEGFTEINVDYRDVCQKQMDNDIQQGLIMTKEKFDALHYQDPLIAELKKTDNVYDLYRVAKDIVCGESSNIVLKEQEDQNTQV